MFNGRPGLFGLVIVDKDGQVELETPVSSEAAGQRVAALLNHPNVVSMTVVTNPSGLPIEYSAAKPHVA